MCVCACVTQFGKQIAIDTDKQPLRANDQIKNHCSIKSQHNKVTSHTYNTSHLGNPEKLAPSLQLKNAHLTFSSKRTEPLKFTFLSHCATQQNPTLFSSSNSLSNNINCTCLALTQTDAAPTTTITNKKQ